MCSSLLAEGRGKRGADARGRTENLRFTKPLLCQLSYVGADSDSRANR